MHIAIVIAMYLDEYIRVILISQSEKLLIEQNENTLNMIMIVIKHIFL